MMAKVFLTFIFLVGTVSSSPVKPRDEHSAYQYRPMVQPIASKPIYDDETTTTVRPTKTTQPQTPTPMSLDKFNTIRAIQRYQKALRRYMTTQPQGTLNETWKEQSARLRVSEDQLNNMTVSELHGILINIKEFYSATLSNLCCPLGK